MLYVNLTYPYNILSPAPNTLTRCALIVIGVVGRFREGIGLIALLVRELFNCLECVHMKKKNIFSTFLKLFSFVVLMDNMIFSNYIEGIGLYWM